MWNLSTMISEWKYYSWLVGCITNPVPHCLCNVPSAFPSQSPMPFFACVRSKNCKSGHCLGSGIVRGYLFIWYQILQDKFEFYFWILFRQCFLHSSCHIILNASIASVFIAVSPLIFISSWTAFFVNFNLKFSCHCHKPCNCNLHPYFLQAASLIHCILLYHFPTMNF